MVTSIWLSNRAESRAHSYRAAAIVAAVAAVFSGLMLIGALTLVQALLGAVLILGAVWVVWPHAQATLIAGYPIEMAASPREPPIDQLIAAFPDAVVLLDRDERVIAFNAAARNLAPVLRLREPASIALRIPEVVEAVRKASASGQPSRVEFMERVPADRWLEALVMPMRLNSVSIAPDFLFIVFHDLSAIRRVEEMRADFVANASHELRTPLAALSGFIETLQGPARDDPKARERFLGIMQAQADRMARLIDDLLSLSRIELSAHVQPSTEVDLVAIVRQVIDALQMLASDRGVAIQVDAPKELKVVGDHDELTRVFENLIENALKYGGSGKRVDIAFQVAPALGGGSEARVTVRDYGPGIAAEHLPRLTERFYRVDVVDSRSQGGTGLGLALVKHILNRHRGKLAIDSKLGEGASFTVKLPMKTSGGTS